MATAMHENLLFELYSSLGTSRVITLVNKNKKGIDKSVCISLSNESLITIGELVSWRLSSLHYHEQIHHITIGNGLD